jgi:hypothetical protein
LAKTLELQFVTVAGKSARVTLDNPKEPVDPALVKQSMEQIIVAGAFYSASGDYVSVQGARVIERNVTDYEI